MTGAGKALMGIGRGFGPTRAVDAALAAISSPLLDFPIAEVRRVPPPQPPHQPPTPRPPPPSTISRPGRARQIAATLKFLTTLSAARPYGLVLPRVHVHIFCGCSSTTAHRCAHRGRPRASSSPSRATRTWR